MGRRSRSRAVQFIDPDDVRAVARTVDGFVRVSRQAIGHAMDSLMQDVNRKGWCHEHLGRCSGETYQCGACGKTICRDCVVLLKKHQPCPQAVKAQRDRVLARAVNETLDWPLRFAC